MKLKTEINLLIDENAKARDYILELEATIAMSNSNYEEVSEVLIVLFELVFFKIGH